MLHEVKAGSGELTPREIEQFEDYMLAIRQKGGTSVTKGRKGVEERVTKAVYTFVDSEGARVNAKTIERWLGLNEELVVEVFDSRGTLHKFSGDDVGELASVVGVT